MEQAVLNPVLYDRLEKVFGEVKVSNPGNKGSYTLNEKVMTKAFTQSRRKKYAQVDDWGEVYSVDCPVCGDTRSRLYFSYLFNCRIKVKSDPVTYFSRQLFKCWNEDCRKELKSYIDKVIGDDESFDLNKIKPDIVESRKSAPSSSSFNKYLRVDVTVPSHMYHLVSDAVPRWAVEYLENTRGYTAEELEKKYSCKFIPEGSKWEPPEGSGRDPVTFREPRLFIPIIQSRKLVSWQATLFRKAEKGEMKYMNMPGTKSCIYNMDTANKYNDVMITEGVTDVWRCGDQSMALLGSNFTEDQAFCLKTIWGKRGRAVFLVEPDARKKMLKAAERCFDEGAFPDGITLIGLNKGDPDDHTNEEIINMFGQGLDKAVKEKNKLEFIEESRI